MAATTNFDTWYTQDNYVERLLENASIQAANPDDTLFVAGPPRYDASAGDSFSEKLLPIGQVMNFSYSNAVPVQPMTSFGSGRSFYVRGKSSVTGNIGRILLDGRNLPRALYTNAVQAGIDVSKFDDGAAANTSDEGFYGNLDSELFYIPFGLGVFIRNKLRQSIASLYFELCMITNQNLSMAAGQPTTMEGISFIADRVRIIDASNIVPQASGGEDAPTFEQINQNILGLGATLADIVPNLTSASGEIK